MQHYARVLLVLFCALSFEFASKCAGEFKAQAPATDEQPFGKYSALAAAVPEG